MAVPTPPFTEELEEFRQVVRRFVANELAPHAAEWEEAKWFPNEVFEKLAAQGYLGLKYPAEYGGSDGGYLPDAVLSEELARCRSGGLAAGIGAHIGIATPPVWKFGTDEQKERYLAPAIRGEKIAALGITEPGAGSDVAGIRTQARRVDGGYVVSGEKTYITNGVRADFVVTAVRTKPEGGHGGISFLLLEQGMPGFEVSRKLEKMGWQASDTAELSFTDVEVPAENLLGPEHGGFDLIMANFQWERLLMALGAVGAMRRLLEVTIAYALEREAFGRPIGRFQVIRHNLAEIGLKLEASRALTYHALREFIAPEAERREAIAAGDWGHPSITAGLDEVTKAKLLTQRAAVEVADECLQIHGGYGYMREYGIERALRDLRLGPIGGGTDEVMKEILGKRLGL